MAGTAPMMSLRRKPRSSKCGIYRNVTPAVSKELMCVQVHACVHICTNQSIWH